MIVNCWDVIVMSGIVWVGYVVYICRLVGIWDVLVGKVVDVFW